MSSRYHGPNAAETQSRRSAVVSCELLLPWHGGSRDDHEHPDVPLDPSCRFRLSECANLAEDVLGGRQRRTRRLAAGILSQAAFHLGGPLIAYSRDTNWYTHHPLLTYRRTVESIDKLCQGGLLTSAKPPCSEVGFQSVLAAGPRLIEELGLTEETRTLEPLFSKGLSAKRSANMVGCPCLPEWVVPNPILGVSRCRRSRGVLAFASPASCLRPVLGQIRTLNRDLLRTPTWLNTAKTSSGFVSFETDRGRSQRVNLFSRQLHASYVALRRDRWKYGGRLYGGWWQTIPKQARKHITIAGEWTTEPDFGCLHPGLMYAAVGAELEGDAYEVAGFGRTTCKVALNTLINSTSESQAIRSLTDQRPSSSSSRLSRHEAERLVNALHKRHRQIRGLLGRDAGIVLQNVAGRMCLVICRRLFGEGIPVLPVHDSFVCRERDAARVEEVMREELDKTKARLRSDGLRLPA